MATIKHPDHPSIVERMQRIRTRLHLEEVSGISVADKEAFLAFCKEQEVSEHNARWGISATLPTKRENWFGFFDPYNDGSPLLITVIE